MRYLKRASIVLLIISLVVFVSFISPREVFATTCDAGTPTGTNCVVLLTTGSGAGPQTWNVPLDWNSSSNQIAAIGSGATGCKGTNGGSGGGGGAYASTTNITLTAGGTAQYAIGASASSSGQTNATELSRVTYFNGSSSSTASVTADWGRAISPSGAVCNTAAGGTVANSVGTTKFAGGNAGTNFNASGDPSGGGGGSAGEFGIGKAGGAGGNGTTLGGGGGGGSDGGSSSAGTTATLAAGSAGGNGTDGTGGGTNSGGNATSAKGAGGGGSGTTAGGIGSIDTSFDSTHGAGGGGGGSRTGNGGAGATYGGGGGGTTSGTSAGTGGQGIIIIIYTPLSTTVVAGPAILAIKGGILKIRGGTLIVK